MDVCPEDCLQLVPLDQIDFPDDTVEHIRNNVELYAVELDDVAADELGIITGSAMLKDETKCIRCGLCAARCPVNVITMEAYHWVVKSPTGLIPPQSLYMREGDSCEGEVMEQGKRGKTREQSNDDVTRRDSFIKIGIGSLAVAGCGAAVFGYQFLSPNVLYEPSPIANVGKPDRFPPDSVTVGPGGGHLHRACRRGILRTDGYLHASRVSHGMEA